MENEASAPKEQTSIRSTCKNAVSVRGASLVPSEVRPKNMCLLLFDCLTYYCFADDIKQILLFLKFPFPPFFGGPKETIISESMWPDQDSNSGSLYCGP